MHLEQEFYNFLCLSPDCIMTQHQWKEKVESMAPYLAVSDFSFIDFFFSIYCSNLILFSEWGLRANWSLNKKLPAEVLSQPLNLGSRELWQAEESFVFRLWQEWKKIPTICLCSIIQACLNGEGLMRNVVFENASFKNSQSILTVQFHTIIINRIQTTNQRLCYYFLPSLMATDASFLHWLCSKRSWLVIIIKCVGENIPILPGFYRASRKKRIKEKPILNYQTNRSCSKSLSNPPLPLPLLTY